MGAMVRLTLGSGEVRELDVEEYVRGVLPKEMSTGWPAEALKAQAVTAKSYALSVGQVTDDTSSQVFGEERFPDTDAAAEAVRGVFLGHSGRVITPFFFGHCNGRTRPPSAAGWATHADRPFLAGVDCGCGF